MGAPGFDDSPTRAVACGAPRRITFVYPYYENPQFLERQIDGWRQYPEDLAEMIDLIICDDGSPTAPAREVLRRCGEIPFVTQLFRIEVDVRWNWLAARNIGMNFAADGWCLLTDMDHVVGVDLARKLVCGLFDPGTVYRISRREHTGAPIHPHPNTMVITREMFWRIGGYDEALSGHYGTDGDWRRRIVEHAEVALLPDEITRHEYVLDSSTTNYKRKQPEDAGKKRIIAARGPGWRPRVLSFPFHQVEL